MQNRLKLKSTHNRKLGTRYWESGLHPAVWNIFLIQKIFSLCAAGIFLQMYSVYVDFIFNYSTQIIFYTSVAIECIRFVKHYALCKAQPESQWALWFLATQYAKIQYNYLNKCRANELNLSKNWARTRKDVVALPLWASTMSFTGKDFTA